MRVDVIVSIVGSLVCFVAASVFMSGWPQGLVPQLGHPYIYAGDALFQHWMAQRAIEGWVFQGSRSGFPFGSSFLDFPGSDAGNLLLLKLLGSLTGNWVQGGNLYLLLSFPFAFAAFYVAARRMSIGPLAASAMGVLFAFLPYHFARVLAGHFFYTWYGVVPIYLLAAHAVFTWSERPTRNVRDLSPWCAALLVASCFGVYFAFFGCMVIVGCALGRAFLREQAHARARPGAGFSIGSGLVAGCFCAVVAAGVVINVSPSAAHVVEYGRNPEAAARVPFETEVYALKIAHLLVPQDHHRLQGFSEFGAKYRREFPLSNTISYLGLVGVLGFFYLLQALLRNLSGRPADAQTRFLTTVVVVVLLTSTVGGLNVIFALFVSPMLRGWDRISIFVACACLLAVAHALEGLVHTGRRKPALAWVAAATLVLFGLADQTVRPSVMLASSSRAGFEADRQFFTTMERMLPEAAAVYQLPYIAFPESAPLVNLGPYDPLAGYLQTTHLRWNTGAMRGTAADLFYRTLATRPVAEQVPALLRLGFRGVSLDRRGYVDGGEQAIAEWGRVLGQAPALARSDGQKVFFSLSPRNDQKKETNQ